MKKLLISALILAYGLGAGAQEKKTVTLPSWVNDVKLSGYAMTQYSYTDEEGAKANSFNLRLIRLSLDGRVANDFYWKLQFQANGNTANQGGSPRIVDAFAEWQKYDFARIKVGQFKRAFTFENPMHPITEGFYTYAQAINKLAGMSDRTNEHSSNGRDIGVQLQGDFLKNSNGRNLLHYQIGVYNGQGINKKDVDQQKDIIGGLWVMPIKGMRIGAFGWTGSYARKGKWTEINATTGDEEAHEGTRRLQKRRYAFSAEYLTNDWTFRTEYIHSTGYAFAKSANDKENESNANINAALGDKADAYYAAVIAPVIKKKLYAKARYDLYRSTAEWNSARSLYEVGMNYEFNKNIQVNFEYAFVNDRNKADKNSNMIDVQLDFKF
jgi:hypothetical protein